MSSTVHSDLDGVTGLGQASESLARFGAMDSRVNPLFLCSRARGAAQRAREVRQPHEGDFCAMNRKLAKELKAGVIGDEAKKTSHGGSPI